MPRKVLKFVVPDDSKPHNIPCMTGDRIVHVAEQGRRNEVSVWFERTLNRGVETVRTYQLFGTGDMLPEEAADYIGTVVLPTHVSIVLHLYEMRDL